MTTIEWLLFISVAINIFMAITKRNTADITVHDVPFDGGSPKDELEIYFLDDEVRKLFKEVGEYEVQQYDGGINIKIILK